MTKETSKISFKYNLKVYFSFLKKYKWLFTFALFFILLVEAASVLERYLFKIIIDRGTEFATDNSLLPSFIKTLIYIAISFVVLVVIGTAIFRFVYIRLLNVLESKLVSDLKTHYFNHILDLDYGFHVKHKTGSLISRLSRGSRSMERMTDVIGFNIAPLVFQLIILISTLIYLDKLSAIVIGIIIVFFIAYGLYIQKIQQSASLEANRAEDMEKANISDVFTNIDSVRYFGKENFIKARFAKLVNISRIAALKDWNYYSWFSAGQSILLGLGTFFLIYLPITRLLAGEITIGTVAFIYSAYIGLMGPMFGFMHGIREFYRAMADFEDLFEYGKVESSIKDKSGAKQLSITKGEIEFRNIDFSYEKRKIFQNFSLKIPRNKKIALVGHSGSGKTTLVKLLYRLYNVDNGEILIDNQNIQDVKQESLRSEMSIVPQECILFDDTIYNNILFSNPKASKKEVLEAIRFARLDKVIKDFPNKENTIVGERGVKLSGGEKQRVSIARAILANKKILALDEATSSLDSETEYEIQRDLQKLMEGRTSIIIAHRLSTIMHADTIVVFKKGKIVQMGNHNKLINQPGEYKKLWNLQRGGYLKE